jgi:hypothetical protein
LGGHILNNFAIAPSLDSHILNWLCPCLANASSGLGGAAPSLDSHILNSHILNNFAMARAEPVGMRN